MGKAYPVFGPENDTKSPTVAVFGPDKKIVPSLPLLGPKEAIAVRSLSIFSPETVSDSRGMAVFSAPSAVPNIVVAANTKAHQGQREIDRIIRKFLKRIKAQDIRYRRIGHTTYTWLYEQEPEPSDTGSDVRWEIRLTANQLTLGINDIKPFFRIVSAPFDVEKLVQTYKQIVTDMDVDAGQE